MVTVTPISRWMGLLLMMAALFFGLISVGLFVILFGLPSTSIYGQYGGTIKVFAVGNPGFLALQFILYATASLCTFTFIYRKRGAALRAITLVLVLIQLVVAVVEVIARTSGNVSAEFYIEWFSIAGFVLALLYCGYLIYSARAQQHKSP